MMKAPVSTAARIQVSGVGEGSRQPGNLGLFGTRQTSEGHNELWEQTALADTVFLSPSLKPSLGILQGRALKGKQAGKRKGPLRGVSAHS